MGPEILPVEYGGRAAEIPIELAVQQLPAWQQRQLAAQQAQQGGAAGATAVQAAGECKAAAAEEEGGKSAAEVAGPLHLHTASMRLSESCSNLAAVPV